MSKKKSSSKDEDEIRVGLDLGGTKMLAKVFDGDWETLGKSKRKTHGHKGAEAGLDRMVETVEEALDDADVKAKKIASIGVGCPGPIHPGKGIIVEAPNLGWENVSVVETLAEAFDCPVTICNDVDAGAFAEYEYGAAKDADRAVAIFPGTGIGAGAVFQGQLLQGNRLSCMELGHMPLFPETSGEGEDGTTLEMACSRLKIASEAARAAYRGQAPRLMKKCGADITQITSGKLADAIEHGDEEIERIVRRAATLLGCGVATVIHLFSPDMIVLGGGLVEAMPDIYLEAVRESTVRRVLPAYHGSYEIVAAELEDDAGVLGAAAWAWRKAQGG